MPAHVVVVGAGLAGSRCAQTLRAEGFGGAITLVGEERHLPYERPALSKAFLAGERTELQLQPAGLWADLGIDLRLGTRADRIDVAKKVMRTSSGDLRWDVLVLATGARPRRLPNLAAGTDVHVLRTLDDAHRLRQELLPGRRLAIVGAGFVGAEVASTATDLGLDVALVDAGRLPFERLLGQEMGALLADRYRAHGVDLRLGTGVGGLRRDRRGAVAALTLADGSELPADVVLVAVGAEPAGDPLGLPTGIPTDGAGRTAFRDVYACGDVAAVWHAPSGRHLRLEHWTSAAGQAAAVARTILGGEEPSSSTPYFWSDQFGLRLQHVGSADGWSRAVLEGSGDSIAARYLDADDRLVAALLVNMPERVGELRRQLVPELVAA
jgi:NADPH-dependent 2,4-dienoyl-CoA reductase/sulfur reductase-like enzyme